MLLAAEYAHWKRDDSGRHCKGRAHTVSLCLSDTRISGGAPISPARSAASGCSTAHSLLKASLELSDSLGQLLCLGTGGAAEFLKDG
jgi:hypothetical protein